MLPHILPVLERAGRLALRFHGFESRNIQTRAGRVHAYVAEGQGTLPTLVLLHAMAGTSTPFANLMLRLRPHARRVIALDMPGHGFSEAPRCVLTPMNLANAVAEAIAHFGDEPKILIGNSLGGALALQLAVDTPDQVAALALLSPAGARIAQHEWDSLLETFDVKTEAAARALLGRIHHRTPWYAPAFSRDLLTSLRRPAVRDVLQTVSPEDAFAPHHLSDLPMPILLVWGRSERILPPSAFEYFKTHLPSHTRIEQPHGFGHCPHLDDPDRVALRVLDFARHALRNSRVPTLRGAPRQALRTDWLERRSA